MTRSALVLGSGAREHALALALAQSSAFELVWVAPGNDWMAASQPENLQCLPEVSDHQAMLKWAQQHHPLLTVVGPETLLAEGVVDAFEAAGLPILGPTKAASAIESDKAFAKQLMQEAGVPTAKAWVCETADLAVAKAAEIPGPWVLKASGLAAGKGVFVCHTWSEVQAALPTLRSLGGVVLVEECLVGQELSAFALCDGERLRLFPLARDHKRLETGDQGPNTGGMGAFSPVPGFDEVTLTQLKTSIFEPTLAALKAQGRPFKGILYAGLMATASGLKVLEFNARLGDPEAQVVLARIDEDLGQHLLHAARGELEPGVFKTKDQVALTVVLAAKGYPHTKTVQDLHGLESAQYHARLFGGALRKTATGWASLGGRVLSAVGTGDTFEAARQLVYTALDQVVLEGKQLRVDIGPKVLRYADTGVNIEAASEALQLAFGARTQANGFAGVFDALPLLKMPEPVLLATCDGVGTKALLAAELNQLEGLGEDLVAHNINDLLVHGGKPLFLLDYLGVSRMKPAQAASLIGHIQNACERYGVTLLGGECAEMPEVYQHERFELMATLVGVASKSELLGKEKVELGDRVLALPSAGLHTNGYTLARKALAPLGWQSTYLGTSETLAEALLRPHRCYLREIEALRAAKLDLHALVHITGGGLVDNPPRVLPKHLAMRLHLSAWQLPPLFQLLAEVTRLEPWELRRVFNLGLGMLLIVNEASVPAARKLLPELVYVGDITLRQDAAVEFV